MALKPQRCHNHIHCRLKIKNYSHGHMKCFLNCQKYSCPKDMALFPAATDYKIPLVIGGRQKQVQQICSVPSPGASLNFSAPEMR